MFTTLPDYQWCLDYSMRVCLYVCVYGLLPGVVPMTSRDRMHRFSLQEAQLLLGDRATRKHAKDS